MNFLILLGEDADMRSRNFSSLLLAVLTLFSIHAKAKVILLDEQVEMQSYLNVLGNTYLSSFSGSLQMQTSPLRTGNYVGLLSEQDAYENDYFSGLTQDPMAPNTFAYLGSRTELSWKMGRYSYWLYGIRGHYGIFPDSPEADEAYRHSIVDDFVKITARFRIDGDGAMLLTSSFAIRDEPPIEHFLYDHTTGEGIYLDGYSALQDGHVYTMTSCGYNESYDDDYDVVGGFYFLNSPVVMAEPSVDLLWLLSLSSLLLIRGAARVIEG
jgi:hypothetical protein